MVLNSSILQYHLSFQQQLELLFTHSTSQKIKNIGYRYYSDISGSNTWNIRSKYLFRTPVINLNNHQTLLQPQYPPELTESLIGSFVGTVGKRLGYFHVTEGSIRIHMPGEVINNQSVYFNIDETINGRENGYSQKSFETNKR